MDRKDNDTDHGPMGAWRWWYGVAAALWLVEKNNICDGWVGRGASHVGA